MSPCRRPPQRCVPQPRAFTLIELLVVISVIALLISILLPALSAARETAQAIQCASGLRQAMIGIFMYADDHDAQPPFSFWQGTGMSNSDPPSHYRTYASALAPHYVTNPAVFFCPKQSTDDLEYLPRLQNENIPPQNSLWSYLAYGANRFGFMLRQEDLGKTIGGHFLPAMPKLHQFASPSDLVGLAEGQTSAGRGVPGEMRPSSTSRLLAPRHPSQTGNMAYVDGHIERPDLRSLGFNPDAGPFGTWVSTMNSDRNRSPWWEFRWVSP